MSSRLQCANYDEDANYQKVVDSYIRAHVTDYSHDDEQHTDQKNLNNVQFNSKVDSLHATQITRPKMPVKLDSTLILNSSQFTFANHRHSI